ncbi:VanZ family protein [Roseovarius faecimaris]|uniref:VanZ family protein n=1 Tax=Roseovarius faecimaris TaxID=2494550 RepID=A0A6I6INJ1_9RHOB|nr:VanZ family protein [Roseovarius faecimaris]QGX97383.1 VanZ family protein [Roseovarius faecimaris]
MRPPLLIATLLTALIGGVIAYGTLMPPGPPGPPLPLTDKQMHALAFFSLVLPLGWVRPRWALGLALVAFAFGGAIEIVQPQVGRSGEWADLWADGLGIVAGLLPGQLRRYRASRA